MTKPSRPGRESSRRRFLKASLVGSAGAQQPSGAGSVAGSFALGAREVVSDHGGPRDATVTCEVDERSEAMSFFGSAFYRKYLVPGLVFQSVVIAGGYGTGRELVEYFLKNGPAGGLLGMFAVTAVVWSLLLALTFEFARTFRAYDYRSLFRALLGRFWFTFEILYFVLLVIVLAVVGSASGVLLRDTFAIPYIAGVMLVLAVIGFLAFKGNLLVERFLSTVSILLYVVFGLLLALSLARFGPLMQERLGEAVARPGWSVEAFKYALYNIAVIPAVLFCVRSLETRKEAIGAGLLAGLLGILPGALILFALIPHYPSILPREVPVLIVIRQLDVPPFLYLYQIVLFGALLTTGIGFIHAVNERLDSAFHDRGRQFPQWARPAVAVGLLLVGLVLSTFGLIGLVSQGYGTTSYGVFFVYALPMATLGVYRILRAPRVELQGTGFRPAANVTVDARR